MLLCGSDAAVAPGSILDGSFRQIQSLGEFQHAFDGKLGSTTNVGVDVDFILPGGQYFRQIGEAIHRHPWAMRAAFAGGGISCGGRFDEDFAGCCGFHFMEDTFVGRHDELIGG